MSPDPNDEYFSEGMTEELISTVSKIGDLQVIARTSVLRYKGGIKSIEEIGRELKVGTVLEGSVRKALGLPDTTLEENMSFVFELMAHILDFGTAVVEDVVLIAGQGAESLTPYELVNW